MSLKAALEHYRKAPAAVVLTPGIQHYPWGDPCFIPDLLGMENRDGRPHAELWLGAHPSLPAKATLAGLETDLAELIETAGEEVLGVDVMGKFQRFPFLLKILTAARPLSIQVHPTKKQAEGGFASENTAGISLSASDRNYKDDNHKPELIVALKDLYALRGFRPLEEIADFFGTHKELQRALPEFRQAPASLRKVYEAFMRLPQEQVDALLSPLVEQLEAENASHPFSKEDRGYWVLRADQEYSQGAHRDRGLLSFYLLNLIHLRPGQALYLPAGILHAYLEGAGVEIMANSDNVLRGGLTPKHVDVPKLLETVIFQGERPEILEAVSLPGTGESRYATPAAEFELHRFEVPPSCPWQESSHESGEILLFLSEDPAVEIRVACSGETLRVGRGGAVFLPRGKTATIESTAPVTVFKALIPSVTRTAASGGESMASAVESTHQFRGKEPVKLAFGTSGLRGKVTDITDLEAYINTRGFLAYLSSTGETNQGDTISLAGDLRPSTDGEERSILRAVARAVQDAGLQAEYLGRIPTPALTYHGIRKHRPSVMVTGSHIPFDRNGIKFNKSSGEVLKEDEPGILAAVERIRSEEYSRPAETSLFRDDGMFQPEAVGSLPPRNDEARDAYLKRYVEFFPSEGLRGMRLVFYEHSAVGRELIVGLLRALGAEVLPLGRSTEFVAIDTEAITDERLAVLQSLADEGRKTLGKVDAVVSTDGDSDRPLLAGVDGQGKVHFFGGDLLGVVVADTLEPDCVAVPISANDAVDLHFAQKGIQPLKTKIGSPYVIAAMRDAVGIRRMGWEANGGFLTGSDIDKGGKILKSLPTRDAVLPLLAPLLESVATQRSLVDMFADLPQRFGKAGLIDEFPNATGRALVQRYSPGSDALQDVSFAKGRVLKTGVENRPVEDRELTTQLHAVKEELEEHFNEERGFGEIVRLNTIDGVRMYFGNGDIAHIRPSGNAPQLRLYAVADSQERADEIVRCALEEPHGILREMEARLTTGEPSR